MMHQQRKAGARSERIEAGSKTYTPRERTLSWPGLGASASGPDRRRALHASARCHARGEEREQRGPIKDVHSSRAHAVMAGTRSERIEARSKACTPGERTLSWPGLGASASRPDRRRALLASARCPKVSRLSDYPQGGPLLKADSSSHSPALRLAM